MSFLNDFNRQWIKTFNYKKQLLKKPKAKEWERLGCCISCGLKLGWLRRKLVSRDLCAQCDRQMQREINEESQALQEMKREQEARAKARSERQRLLSQIPDEMRDIGIRAIAAKISQDTPVKAVAVALWSNEIGSAERAAGEVAMRLLTGGFVGDLASKTMSFGIIALTDKNLWRIEIGYSLNSVDFHSIEIIQSKKLRLERATLMTELQEIAEGCILQVSSPSQREIRLVFPSGFPKDAHPFFELAMDNLQGARQIARLLQTEVVDQTTEAMNHKSETEILSRSPRSANSERRARRRARRQLEDRNSQEKE